MPIIPETERSKGAQVGATSQRFTIQIQHLPNLYITEEINDDVIAVMIIISIASR